MGSFLSHFAADTDTEPSTFQSYKPRDFFYTVHFCLPEPGRSTDEVYATWWGTGGSVGEEILPFSYSLQGGHGNGGPRSTPPGAPQMPISVALRQLSIPKCFH
ncbi:hypothetical protein MRX96_019083 [Rhipicephalus microplus]